MLWLEVEDVASSLREPWKRCSGRRPQPFEHSNIPSRHSLLLPIPILTSSRVLNMGKNARICRNLAGAAAFLAASTSVICAAETGSLEQRLNDLESQNRSLREELASQKKLIEELRTRESSSAS